MGLTKFERTNQAGGKDAYVAVDGTLTAISSVEKTNTNGTAYHSFSAEVQLPSGPARVAGKVYNGLLPHIGGMPVNGAKLQFNSLLQDLKDGFNTRWNIGGASVDSVDALLSDIADL